jgi:hypothetical protein
MAYLLRLARYMSHVVSHFSSLLQYIRLPSPFEPYVLRFVLQGASAVCRNGRFLTNYPFSGYIPHLLVDLI